MERDEVQRYIDVTIAHSATIDVREVPEAPGFLRTITLRDGGRVTIEYETCEEYVSGDFEGGGLKYYARYESLDAAIVDLEQFLEKPLAEWTNFTREGFVPSVVTQPDPAANLTWFENLVRARAVPLPRGARYVQASIYFRHIERYGEPRPDKLAEEDDLHASEHGPYDDELDS